MKLSNKRGYPQALYDAIKNDSYTKGRADFSVTELLKPSRQWVLQLKHSEELVEDVEDRLWSLYGQVVHLILERANRKDFAEERLFVSVNEKILSGQIDTLSLDDGTLSDWKFTSSFGFSKGMKPKDEWIQQLNMQNFLLNKNGYHPKKLQIVGLLRDFQLSKAKFDPKYPKHPVMIQEIPMWSLEDTENFIIERMKSHRQAMEILPNCTPKETWGSRRCQDYCNVSKFCDQYKSACQTGRMTNG